MKGSFDYQQIDGDHIISIVSEEQPPTPAGYVPMWKVVLTAQKMPETKPAEQPEQPKIEPTKQPEIKQVEIPTTLADVIKLDEEIKECEDVLAYLRLQFAESHFMVVHNQRMLDALKAKKNKLAKRTVI